MNEQFLATLETSRKYTIAAAKAMPEESYHFKPAGGGWNFLELMHHIAYGIVWWNENYIKGKDAPWEPPPTVKNKRAAIDYLTDAYGALRNSLEGNKLTEAAINGFHATIDHTTHHRGQAVVYLRCHGITPPEYTY